MVLGVQIIIVLLKCSIQWFVDWIRLRNTGLGDGERDLSVKKIMDQNLNM